MKSMLPVQNSDVLGALRGFLKSFLETGTVDALYVPLETEKGAIVPALVTDPARLEHLNPLAPAMPINGARAVSALTGKHPPAHMAVLLRPCELRALVELVKLQQASLEGVTLISMDCPGTFELADYTAHKKNGGFDLPAYLAAAQNRTRPRLGWPGAAQRLPDVRPTGPGPGCCLVCTCLAPTLAPEFHLKSMMSWLANCRYPLLQQKLTIAKRWSSRW